MTTKIGDEDVYIDTKHCHLLREYDWKVKTINGYQYVTACADGRELFLHRLIMDPKARQHVRFRNGDGLDVRVRNLRILES